MKRSFVHGVAALSLAAIAVAGCSQGIVSGSGDDDDDVAGAPDGAPGPGPDAGAGGGPDASDVPPPVPTSGVEVHLERLSPAAEVASFGLPVPRGAVADPATVRVLVAGTPVPARARAILDELDADGNAVGVRALLIQLDADLLVGGSLDVHVLWNDDAGEPPDPTTAPFRDVGVSFSSPDTVPTATRTIENAGGVYSLVETEVHERTLLVGREPSVLATFPAGYLASTGILGRQVSAGAIPGADLGGLSFLSDAIGAFGRSARYHESYRVDDRAVPDLVGSYEAWLYDRCATYLTDYVHTGEVEALRHGYRACSWYAEQIQPNGIFAGKPSPDPKYSHARGLFAYYALTGDERAFDAGVAVADLWLNDGNFVAPYRDGHVRGIDKLWTERLLGTSIEGLFYGLALTGRAEYLQALRDMIDTAYLHVTGDASVLATINPGLSFPPQNCFIHSAEQHAEGGRDEPWCSGWMNALLLDGLLAYQELTGDARVDEILVRQARFLRDVGTVYFEADPYADSFLSPSVCYDPSKGYDPRILVPLYGAGIDAEGTRRVFGEWSDFEHCADATALTAAAIRALVRQGTFDDNPIGPFASEGESFMALHHELAFCARTTFDLYTRPRRAPSSWSSGDLASGAGSPASFIEGNRIGWPVHHVAPLRKLSWWFNQSMLGFGLLDDAGIALPAIEPGQVQPAGCD